MKRVVITGMGAVTAFGESWEQLKQGLLSYHNAVVYMPEWECYQGLGTKLGAPRAQFQGTRLLPAQENALDGARGANGHPRLRAGA